MRNQIRVIAGSLAVIAAVSATATQAGPADGAKPVVTSPSGLPALAHAGLFFVGGPDDPTEIVFKSTVPLGIEANGTTIRGGVSVLGRTGSLGHLDGPGKPCYIELAPSPKHMLIGHRYALRITLGDGPTAATFVKTKTLVRDGSAASIRRQMDC
ncbi:MAG TPA: hypothetical protein VIJ51_02085 [Solirubrobacteraceae bacterium]